MSTALVPTLAGRPSIVTVNGGTVYISVHDQAHLATRAGWKRHLRAVHSDYGLLVRREKKGRRLQPGETPAWMNRARLFRNAIRGFRQWQHSEVLWYLAYGLTPPTACRLRPGFRAKAAPHAADGVATIPCPECDRPFIPKVQPGVARRRNVVCGPFCAGRRLSRVKAARHQPRVEGAAA